MASSVATRRLWLMVLLALVLVTLTSHLVGVVAGAGATDHTRLEPATGCLHTGVLLPGGSVLVVAFAPHFVLSVAPPSLHDTCIPAPLHPPIRTASH